MLHLREDLLSEVEKLAKTKAFDYLLIESTGISEPMPVAETFEFRTEDGKSLSDFAHIDTMVTVIDASTFEDYWQSSETLIDKKVALGDDDKRSFVDLINDQIEFADVLLLNKGDLVETEDLRRVEGFFEVLMPTQRYFQRRIVSLIFQKYWGRDFLISKKLGRLRVVKSITRRRTIRA